MAVRQFTFSIDPRHGLNNTLAWDGLAADGNADSKGITCAHMPRTKGAALNVLQEQLLIGGLDLGEMWRTLIADQTKDDSTDFTATGVLNNAQPEELANTAPATIRCVKVEFPRCNPLANSGMTVDFVLDEEKPETSTNWQKLDTLPGSNIAGIPSGIARHISLRVRDTGSGKNTQVVFDSFVLHFYQLQTRHGDD